MLAGLWLCAFSGYALAQENGDEARMLKAAFVYNFAKFTRWPANTWSDSAQPLRLCISGSDELAPELKRLEGKVVGQRRITLQTYARTQSPAGCHLLYIARSEQRHYGKLLNALRGSTVLTVSELPGFANTGGVIELYRSGGRIRFVINLAAARQSGLEFSSRLLDLAVLIGHEVTP